jgi:hypothetical protein
MEKQFSVLELNASVCHEHLEKNKIKGRSWTERRKRQNNLHKNSSLRISYSVLKLGSLKTHSSLLTFIHHAIILARLYAHHFWSTKWYFAFILIIWVFVIRVVQKWCFLMCFYIIFLYSCSWFFRTTPSCSTIKWHHQKSDPFYETW